MIQPRDLHVVAVFFNHNRRAAPLANFRRFAAHVQQDLGVTLHVVELVQGRLPFQVTDPENPRHTQLRTTSEFFQKENLVNIGMRNIVRLFPDAEYLAWWDGDIEFFNRNVATEAIAELNRYAVLQPWGMACSLGPDGHPLIYPGQDQAQVARSFGYCFIHELATPAVTKRYGYEWHTGYAWCIRRDVWEAIGGLYEHSIVGSADTHMAWAFAGKIGWGIDPNCTPAFRADLAAWCERASAVVRERLGYVDGLVHHHWHGRRADRRYVDRWRIPVENAYDPALDLTRDVHGLLHLTGRSPKLQFDVRGYFRARNDDANTVS